MNPITLSVIVLEYNSDDELQKCIDSAHRACHSLSHEIIISSNSCYPRGRQMELQQCYPDVKWVFNPRNGGFSYGMNQGLRMANGRYLLAMNLDVMVSTPLDSMVRFMDAHPEVGAVGPQIVSSKGLIQDSCRPYVSLQSFFLRIIKRLIGYNRSGLSRDFDYSKTQTVDWVIGAFIMMRCDIFKKTGGMDERYFMYAEDLDWCTRIRQLGYETVYFPDVQVVFEGSRNARHATRYAKIFFKSHLLFWHKFGYFCGYPKRKHLTY